LTPPAYERKAKGRTDPWLDLLVKPAEDFDESDRELLCRSPWGAFSINDVHIGRFPEFERLKTQYQSGVDGALSVQALREIKFWFVASCFDVSFLTGAVRLPSGHVCDLTDLVMRRPDGRFVARRKITERHCSRLLSEVYHVLANIVPFHRTLQYEPLTCTGQVELVTTPFAHPILPLLYDTETARRCQPSDSLPPRYHSPEDAETHVLKAMHEYRRYFERSPYGMWPGEGAVSHESMSLYARSGVRWIATDQQILERSLPAGLSHFSPHALSTDWSDIVVFFRDTGLSDKIGFSYQTMSCADAVQDFVNHVMQSTRENDPSRKLVTVILDGENAWEWYRSDHDGREFLNRLYGELDRLYESRELITVTPSEYIFGNLQRGVPPHPPASLRRIEKLWPGSWINHSFRTWIGTGEKNKAWAYLLQARLDLERSGVPRPAADIEIPNPGTREWFAYQAWHALYAAEGSDWFWWCGSDPAVARTADVFDDAFRSHLRDVYEYGGEYGAAMPRRTFDPIVGRKPSKAAISTDSHTGTMAKGERKHVRVMFTCRMPDDSDPTAIYVVGNLPQLGEWVPNKVRMYDDGTHGDAVGGDGTWSLALELPPNTVVEYKYTCDGTLGEWEQGQEFPAVNRTFIVPDADEIVIENVFGIL